MSQCERCKVSFHSHYFEERSAIKPLTARAFCPVCVICVASGYLAKAQLRKVQERERKLRRHGIAPEATQ
jgi:hypothetical protein